MTQGRLCLRLSVSPARVEHCQQEETCTNIVPCEEKELERFQQAVTVVSDRENKQRIDPSWRDLVRTRQDSVQALLRCTARLPPTNQSPAGKPRLMLHPSPQHSTASVFWFQLSLLKTFLISSNSKHQAFANGSF